MSDAVILACEQLSRSFSDGKKEVSVFNDIDFRVERGEMVAIVGASGAGKSTFLHLLGGLDQPTTGAVLIGDQRIDNCSEKKKSAIRNKSLGFVYQFHHLLPEFTALENVCMPLLIRGESHRCVKQQATSFLGRVGLEHRHHHRVGELSGGERQRCAIARALVTKPSCVLADEPTGNLDYVTARQVFDLMLDLNRELSTSFVIVTHNRELAAQLDKTYLLQNGSLKLQP